MNATGSGEPLTHQQAKVWLTKSSFPFLLGDIRGLRVRTVPHVRETTCDTALSSPNQSCQNHAYQLSA